VKRKWSAFSLLHFPFLPLFFFFWNDIAAYSRLSLLAFSWLEAVFFQEKWDVGVRPYPRPPFPRRWSPSFSLFSFLIFRLYIYGASSCWWRFSSGGLFMGPTCTSDKRRCFVFSLRLLSFPRKRMLSTVIWWKPWTIDNKKVDKRFEVIQNYRMPETTGKIKCDHFLWIFHFLL
jgi:hypothetical protein